MRRSDYQREENYNEYLRLLQDDNYVEVTYDETSGGISAIHKYHKFDKQRGPYGLRRGDYERIVVQVLRNLGHRIILESEISQEGIKKCDGLLDDVPLEIKSIEGISVWTISSKLLSAVKQQAQCVAFYFPDIEMFTPFIIKEGIRLASSNPGHRDLTSLTRIMIISSEGLVSEYKKATPIEGWSI